MEKIADDIDKEMTEEEIIKKNKEVLRRGEAAIVAAKKDLEKKPERLIINPEEKRASRIYSKKDIDKTDWLLCPECGKNPIAPWNKSGRCSVCQQYKKKPKKPKLDKADLIAAGKKSMEEEKKTWPICPKCGTRKMAPWNKVGLCSYCQGNRGKKK
ncbi:MAG: hypothetical protein KAT69_10695 [Candidatus Aminicenantes bacterium]|nr:hypothetical protein [Candidatus Aminicenantes bacterium]